MDNLNYMKSVIRALRRNARIELKVPHPLRDAEMKHEDERIDWTASVIFPRWEADRGKTVPGDEKADLREYAKAFYLFCLRHEWDRLKADMAKNPKAETVAALGWW